MTINIRKLTSFLVWCPFHSGIYILDFLFPSSLLPLHFCPSFLKTHWTPYYSLNSPSPHFRAFENGWSLHVFPVAHFVFHWNLSKSSSSEIPHHFMFWKTDYQKGPPSRIWLRWGLLSPLSHDARRTRRWLPCLPVTKPNTDLSPFVWNCWQNQT